VKRVPFPGEDQRSAAVRERLLALLRDWGKNARIRDFLDLDFMADVIRLAADPAAPTSLETAGVETAGVETADLVVAFQIAGLLTALEDYPVDETALHEAFLHEVGE
jgi:hypothetical protein